MWRSEKIYDLVIRMPKFLPKFMICTQNPKNVTPREKELSHTSGPLIHPTYKFDPYKFVVKSSQTIWTGRFEVYKANFNVKFTKVITS